MNIYRSMPPLPEIKCPGHLKPKAHRPDSISHPIHDPVSGEEDGEFDDECTLVELQSEKGTSTSKEGSSSLSLGSMLFPSPPKKSRLAARKQKSCHCK